MVARDDIQIPHEALAELCRRYRVRELSLFGPALRDDFTEDSDLDILVEFEAGTERGLFEVVRLQRELGNLFRRDVDLIPKDRLKPLIRRQILESAEVLYAEPAATAGIW